MTCVTATLYLLLREYTVQVAPNREQDDNEDDVHTEVPGIRHLVHDALELDVVGLDVGGHLRGSKRG